MKAQKQQFVTIKGTKDGLTLHLDDSCSFEELLNELEQMLSLKQYIHEDGPYITVNVKAGNRLLHKKQQDQIEAVIQKKRNLVVETFESNVVTKDHALQMKKEAEVVSVAKMIRSGQVLKVEGDLLLIGDVNPGGTVIARGNIFIMGTLRGIAHAGYNGNKSAVIAASVMKPSQIRICDIVNRAPDYIQTEKHEMECAYIDENESIIIDRLQQLTHLRPNLTRFEGGI
ncbi:MULTISPECIES: septum site-determining protein MinC [Metabacillus]|jgi:septum site-determining protein MinC|uniref:Septum site-determining protein MinC n=1 Tax=Metabacillus hrfriensis TaxID=3048891 RepID=A0ACD4R889_9BACI|nr:MULTISPECIES: septum site-determining protein MinC [Metabacillus]UAL51186.1 septum site-determining protein MinC [Metabacillus dongyingensis]USK27480.1 septum site-determining protein MinC [Bacillus sp. CMF21]WHZ56692.1 septum site-determining protein MinC [Metabacillus sp. CT-WN-B3]